MRTCDANCTSNPLCGLNSVSFATVILCRSPAWSASYIPPYGVVPSLYKHFSTLRTTRLVSLSGNAQELTDCLALDLHIGITGWVCDDRAERGGAELASLLPTIPSDRLMIETDAPYLIPRTIKPAKSRPNRNEPALLPHVLAQVAASLGQSEESVAARSTAVAAKFFRLPADVLG